MPRWQSYPTLLFLPLFPSFFAFLVKTSTKKMPNYSIHQYCSLHVRVVYRYLYIFKYLLTTRTRTRNILRHWKALEMLARITFGEKAKQKENIPQYGSFWQNGVASRRSNTDPLITLLERTPFSSQTQANITLNHPPKKIVGFAYGLRDLIGEQKASLRHGSSAFFQINVREDRLRPFYKKFLRFLQNLKSRGEMKNNNKYLRF